MTISEAKKQINACEQSVNTAYSSLRTNARSVGAEAMRSASNATTVKTLLPLIISVIGLFLLKASAFFAVSLIAGGIVLAYFLHKSAKDKQNKIESRKRILDSTIDANPQI